MIGTIVNFIGALLLVHAGFSYRHYKQLVTKVNLETTGIPIDIIVELAIGFALIVIAQTASLRLKPMKVTASMRGKTYVEVMTNSDYMTFNHRGKFVTDRLRTSK